MAYQCGTCGTSDPNLYQRCTHPGCPDGHDRATSTDPPRGAGQRVPLISDSDLVEIITEMEAGKEPLATDLLDALIDLRDERAASADKDAVIADLRAELAQVKTERDYIFSRRGNWQDRADALARDLAAMTEARDAAWAMLEDCYRQFNFYADEHEKAGKVTKASTNRDFADRIKAALTPPAQPAKEERS